MNITHSSPRKKKLISKLEYTTNDIEQHQRSHSVRIFNLSLPSDSPTDPLTVSQHVYSAISPILKIALDNNSLPSMPSLIDTIDIAHTLPSRNDSTPPIIARFCSKLIRLAVMKSKRSYFSSNPTLKFSITDNLTHKNSLLLKQTKERSDVS